MIPNAVSCLTVVAGQVLRPHPEQDHPTRLESCQKPECRSGAKRGAFGVLELSGNS